MTGNGDGGIEVAVVLQVVMTPEIDLERATKLLNKSLIDWVKTRPSIRVRMLLPIVSDGFTVAVHIWYNV